MHISRSRYDTFVDLWTLYNIRHTWVTDPLHIFYTRASNIVNFVEFRVFAGTPSRKAAIYRGFRATVLYSAYYCTTSERISGIGLSTLELFIFKHARAYCYARFGLSFFTCGRSPTNSKLVRAIPDVFVAGLQVPQSNLRGMVLGVWMAPNFSRGGLKVGQIAFSGESSAF